MKTICATLLVFSVTTLLLPRPGRSDTLHTPAVASAEAFDRLKRLAGQWQGAATEPGAPPNVTVVYRVTSANGVVLETLFPGPTPRC